MFDLACAECSFTTTAESVEAAYDVFEDHRDEYGERHFVNIERIENE